MSSNKTPQWGSYAEILTSGVFLIIITQRKIGGGI